MPNTYTTNNASYTSVLKELRKKVPKKKLTFDFAEIYENFNKEYINDGEGYHPGDIQRVPKITKKSTELSAIKLKRALKRKEE